MVGVSCVHPAITGKEKYNQGEKEKIVTPQMKGFTVLRTGEWLGLRMIIRKLAEWIPIPKYSTRKNSEVFSKMEKKGAAGDKEGDCGERRQRHGFWHDRPRGEGQACGQPQALGAVLEEGKGGEAVTLGTMYVPVAVSGGSGCSSRGCGCSSRLCISVGCISGLQERRELTLQLPLPPEAQMNTHPPTRDRQTQGDTNTDTHMGRGCFKLHPSTCYSPSARVSSTLHRDSLSNL